MTDLPPDPFDSLAGRCDEPDCTLALGDHPYRDFLAHTSKRLEHLPHTDLGAAIVDLGPLGDVALADFVGVQTLAILDAPGGVGLVKFQFEQMNRDGPNAPVTEVVFGGSPHGLRLAGDLLRDACHQAATIAEAAAPGV